MISFLRLMHRPSCKVRSSRDSKGRLTPIFFSLLMTLVHAGAQDVVQEPARQTPVLYDVDVAVIGGGKSGVGAAVGAARMGARTLLIERTGYLGSGYRSLGLGMRLGIRGFRPSLRQAILRDVAERLVEIATPPACLDFVWTLPEAARGLAPGSVTADPRGATTPQPLQECPDLETLSGNEYIAISHHELLPYVFQSLVREAGAQILFFSTYVGAIVEPDPRAGYGSWLHGGPERTIQAVIVQTPTDRFAVRGRIFVDCTGLATVAAGIGAPVRRQNASMGLMSEITNVDLDRYYAWARTRPREGDEALKAWLEAQLGGPVVYPWHHWWQRHSGQFGDLFRKAVEKGEIPLFYRVGQKGIVTITEGLKTSPQALNGGMARPRTDVQGIDPTNIRELSEAHQKSVEYLFRFTAFLNRDIPGFENAQLIRIANATMQRGGRYIDSPIAPTRQEVTEGGQSDEALYVHVRRGGREYEVPYQTLLPRKIDNLLVVGKSSSGGSTFRTLGLTMVMGQAAGTAAAIAAREGVSAREVPMKKLHRALKEAGIYIPDRLLKD